MHKIELEVPEDLSVEEARLQLALRLLETGSVSIGKAAQMAGYSKVAFYEVASKHGVPVLNADPGDLEREVSL